jgi:hypothetical protein
LSDDGHEPAIDLHFPGIDYDGEHANLRSLWVAPPAFSLQPRKLGLSPACLVHDRDFA